MSHGSADQALDLDWTGLDWTTGPQLAKDAKTKTKTEQMVH